MHADRSFYILGGPFADIEIVNPDTIASIDLGKVYAVAYNNEFVTDLIDPMYVCGPLPAWIKGPSIDSIIGSWDESTGMIPNPIDTVKIGSSQKGAGEPQCWYEYKVLSFTRDLSKD